MSNIYITIHWINSIALRKHCAHRNGEATFILDLQTEYKGFKDEPETHSFSLVTNTAAVTKFERIAAFIAAINAEPDDAYAAASQPLIETFAAE